MKVLRFEAKNGYTVFLNTEQIKYVSADKTKDKGFIGFGPDCYVEMSDYNAVVSLGEKWMELTDNGTASVRQTDV